jgi:hypothetical protein
MRKSVTFTGTFDEVKSQIDKWKLANPTARVVRDGVPVTGSVDLHAPCWALIIEYEEPS